MIRRLFWILFGLGLGAVVGIALTRQVQRAANAPAELAQHAAAGAGSALDWLKRWWQATRVEAAAVEQELRSRFAVPDLGEVSRRS